MTTHKFIHDKETGRTRMIAADDFLRAQGYEPRLIENDTQQSAELDQARQVIGEARAVLSEWWSNPSYDAQPVCLQALKRLAQILTVPRTVP